MVFKNLIFNLDGTLIDSSEGVIAAVNYSLRKVGAPEQKPEIIKSFIGYPLETMYPHFTDAPIDELYKHFQVKANTTVVSSTVLLPGVESILSYLCRHGYKMAIATTKIRRNIDGIINKFNWQSVFPVSVGGDEVSRVKPDPMAFRLALKHLEATPDDSLVIGDTVNDILAARDVPMKVASVISPYGGREKLEALQPDFILESIEQLPGILE